MAFRAHGPKVPRTFGNHRKTGGPAQFQALETMVCAPVRRERGGRGQAHPPQRNRGQPRFRPARTASTISTAARNAASISKCVVSSKCASGAALSGAAAPLKAAADAHLLDTTHLDIDAAFRAAVDIVEAVRAGRKRG